MASSKAQGEEAISKQNDRQTNSKQFSQHQFMDSLIVDDLVLQLKQALSGALAGCGTRALTQPLDVLKIRFQLQLEPVDAAHPSKYRSILQALALVYKEEGVRGLWRGHNSGQFMSISYAMGQFWTYERVAGPLRESSLLRHHQYLSEFVAGAIGGCVGSMVAMPFDVVRTRIVAQDPGTGYRNTLIGLVTILREEGVRGCFRGLFPTLVQIIPMSGGNFMFFDIFEHFTRYLTHKPTGHLPTWVNLINGALAGALSKAILYPFDFLKKRMQLQGFERHRQSFGRNQHCVGLTMCIRMTLKEEGPLGFYKGLAPTLLKSSAVTALYFVLYYFFKSELIK